MRSSKIATSCHLSSNRSVTRRPHVCNCKMHYMCPAFCSIKIYIESWILFKMIKSIVKRTSTVSSAQCQSLWTLRQSTSISQKMNWSNRMSTGRICSKTSGGLQPWGVFHILALLTERHIRRQPEANLVNLCAYHRYEEGQTRTY